MIFAVRRWLIVGALLVVSCGMSTLLAAYGVFLPVLADAFGWSRGAIATGLSINLLVGGLAGLGVGALADRHGPRGLLVVTAGLVGLGFALVATVDTLWQLYLLVGVLGGVGTSGFYLVGAATVARWFDERRGLALSLVLMGFNLGYIAGGPLAAWLIAATGWRRAYTLLGGLTGLVAMGAALAVRLPRPGEEPRTRATPDGVAVAGQGRSLREALVDPRQWCLSAAFFLLGGLSLMMSVHIVPFARDRGVGLAAASLALTAYGVGAVGGRIVTGLLADRVPTRAGAATGYALLAATLALIPWAPSPRALLAVLAVFGLGYAATDTLVTKAIPEVFGLRALGAVLGVLTLGWRAGAAVGPATAGFLYDLHGSYAVPFGAAPLVALASLGLFAAGTARPRP